MIKFLRKIYIFLLPAAVIVASCVDGEKIEGKFESEEETARLKRGSAYAGPHPGGGYGSAGVGIPGLNNVIQYSAYNALLNTGHHGGGGGGGGGISGYGSSSHGRKLTVDQAIGQFGHHTLSQPYPYTVSHSPSIQSGYGSAGRNIPIIGGQIGHNRNSQSNHYSSSSRGYGGSGGGYGQLGGYGSVSYG